MTSFAIAARPIPAILNTAHLFSSAIAPIQKQLVGFLDPVDFLAFSAVSVLFAERTHLTNSQCQR
jgi:hypothetical protein